MTPAAHAPAAPQVKKGWIKARLFVPKKHRGMRAHGRKPRYLPTTTTEVDFTLLKIDGSTTTDTAYNFPIYTRNCTNVGGAAPGYVCSVTEPAPAGNDVYQISAGSCPVNTLPNGSCPEALQTLSESYAPIVVPPNGNANASFTLNPVVASLAWSVPTGPNAPYYYNAYQSYACGYSGSSNCYDPIVDPQGTPKSGSVFLNAFDASGAQIVPTASGQTLYGTPLYLKANGDADSITTSCSDPSLTWETGGGPFAAGQMTLANGFGSSAGIDTPVTAPSPSPTTGTDGNGNVVAAVGNNGVEMNYDGTTFPSGAPFSCTATDAQGFSATYYAGNSFVAGVPNPQIFVANNVQPGSVTEFSAATAPSNPISIGSSSVQNLSITTAIAVDGYGDLYEVDENPGHTLYAYTASSLTKPGPTPAATTSLGSSATASAMLYDPYGYAAGDLFVADDANAAVQVYDTSVFSYGQSAPTLLATIPVMNNPAALALDSSGNLYVAGGNQVEEFSYPFSNTSQPSATLTPSSSGLAYPTSMAYDSVNGILYVAYYANQNAIDAYTLPSTTPSSTIDDSSLDDPTSLAVDASGRLYVSNAFGNATMYLSGGTSPALTFSSAPDPSSVWYDSKNNDVYFSLSGNQVQEFPADGSTTTASATYSTGLSSPISVIFYQAPSGSSGLRHRHRGRPHGHAPARTSRARP